MSKIYTLKHLTYVYSIYRIHCIKDTDNEALKMKRKYEKGKTWRFVKLIFAEGITTAK